MKKRIKLRFVDKGTDFVPENDYYYKVLARHYDIEISNNPEYIICSVNGFSHMKYTNCIKIVDIGENICPDFNEFDYAVGFDHLSFGDRYLRVPLYVFFKEYKKLAQREQVMLSDDKKLLDRKFCCFVVSNGNISNPLRRIFFEKLSKYKRVDSGGRWMNNIGGPVKNKDEFIREYKFNIAFENSSSPGYTTEKVMQPLAENVVPIYWGNPLIDLDFQTESMVLIKNEDDIERAIEEIIYLDTHDDAYLKKLRTPCLVKDFNYYDRQLEDFLRHIVDQPLVKAKRLNTFGFQPIYRQRMRRMYKIEEKLKTPYKLLKKIQSLFTNV